MFLLDVIYEKYIYIIKQTNYIINNITYELYIFNYNSLYSSMVYTYISTKLLLNILIMCLFYIGLKFQML